MTRFARAKGSKASNERVPETATTWDEMKTGLKKSQNEVKNKEDREKMNKLRQESYDAFVDDEDKKVGKKWAEFPATKKTPMKAKQKLNKKKKPITTELDVTDEMIEDFDQSDDEIDPKVEDFKKEIEDVLKKEKLSDAPEEQTSKQTPKENNVKNNKKQQKQQKQAQQKQQKQVQQKQVQEKRKMARNKDDTEHKRRKPNLEDEMSITINGEKQQIARYDGFPILETDFMRLKELRNSLMQKGVPQSEVKRTMQSERRKAEKYLSRLKKQVCFNCRKSGHVLSECPDLAAKSGALIEHAGVGICFKCGSTEHKLSECKLRDAQGALKYASCFICREQGHIARACPDNPRGLYPQGGACRTCGDVTHLKKDCPQNVQEKADLSISVGTIASDNIEGLNGEEGAKKLRKTPARKVVKF